MDAAKTSAGTPTRNAMPCILPETDTSRCGVSTGSIGNLAAIVRPMLAASRRIWPTRSRLELDNDVDGPGPVIRCVGTAPGIMLGNSSPNVRREAVVVPRWRES